MVPNTAIRLDQIKKLCRVFYGKSELRLWQEEGLRRLRKSGVVLQLGNFRSDSYRIGRVELGRILLLVVAVYCVFLV
jgi:hypothetical protein